MKIMGSAAQVIIHGIGGSRVALASRKLSGLVVTDSAKRNRVDRMLFR